MYCKKCGTQLDEEVAFCPKCGEGLNQATSTPTPETKPKKKRAKKLPFILGAVVLAIVATAIIATNWNGKIDYVATAKAYEPFLHSQDLPGTCGAVLDKYLNEPQWSSTRTDDIAYVTVSGTLKGTTDEVSITITVAPGETKDTAYFDFAQATVNSNQTTDSNEITILMLAFFEAYNDGQEFFDPDVYL